MFRPLSFHYLVLDPDSTKGRHHTETRKKPQLIGFKDKKESLSRSKIFILHKLSTFLLSYIFDNNTVS
uniref:Ovule protein n=1 Tax=Heterorhabditis bacteriophora TaxID=37862 RepID=A0A1I7WSR6_HETBA